MERRTFNKLLAATALSAVTFGSKMVSAADGKITIGAIGPKTGPLAAGADITFWPNLRLWADQVNKAGGIDVGGKKMPVAIIEYDDKTDQGEHVKLAQRLAEQDKADFVFAPYSTGLTLASAPIYARYDYPIIAVSAVADNLEALTARYPSLFFTLGTSAGFVEGVRDVLNEMRDKGVIGKKVAMVNVADAFGIELSEVARKVLPAAGYELVYDKSYPLGTPDLAPVMQGVINSKPDAFVAWSYPPDTFGLTQQAIAQKLNVKAYYNAVATCFPGYEKAFGSKIENVLGAGGTNPDDPKTAAYRKAHLDFSGKEADYWASANTYASLEILAQAITGAKTIDRKAVTKYIKENSFDTVMGKITFKNNVSYKFWTVGQWQGGKFRGVKGVGLDGAVAARPKENWN
jgi:branched-chain amino acid transport system substrate-binding protein